MYKTKPHPGWGSLRSPSVKFRIPTAENLVPIRLDIDVEGQKYRDTFTWNPTDPESDVTMFAKRTVRDLKLPPTFVAPIYQSIQSQLNEFKSLEGQDMHTGEKIVPIKLDLRVNHTLIKDQFLWPAIAFAIREQLCEIAIQGVASARETKIHKKGRRGAEPLSKSSVGASETTLKLFGTRSSGVRKRREWDLYEPVVDILSKEEVEALEARENIDDQGGLEYDLVCIMTNVLSLSK
nr:chromatin structure-remodeling complex protein BSH [Tanacetum cinerariifolium]